MKGKLYWVSWLVQIFHWHPLAVISSILLLMKLVVFSLLKLVREHICSHWMVPDKLGLVLIECCLTWHFCWCSWQLYCMSYYPVIIIQVHVSATENPEEASFFESFEAAHSSHDLSSSIAEVTLFLLSTICPFHCVLSYSLFFWFVLFSCIFRFNLHTVL